MKLFVYRNISKNTDKPYFSLFLKDKDNNTSFFKIVFPLDKQLEKSSLIKVKDAFFSFNSYVNKYDEEYKEPYLVITDYDIV